MRRTQLAYQLADMSYPKSVIDRLYPEALKDALCTNGAPAMVGPHELIIVDICMRSNIQTMEVHFNDMHEIVLVHMVVRFDCRDLDVYVHGDVDSEDQNTIVVSPQKKWGDFHCRVTAVRIRSCPDQLHLGLSWMTWRFLQCETPDIYGFPPNGAQSQKDILTAVSDLVDTTIRVRVDFQ